MQLYDLSVGGCFINSVHQQKAGVRMQLRIELPHEGWITLRAETLDRCGELGFAVRFVDLSDEGTSRIERAITTMEQQEN